MPDNISASRAAASIALRVLRGFLGDIAQDGAVALADVDRVIRLIERGSVELDRAYAAARERCRVSEARPNRQRVGMRSDPLKRLLVRPFESMFRGEPPAFERKFLPAYFEAARKLIGPSLRLYDEECKGLVQALLAVHGSDLSWDMFYGDPRTVSLTRRLMGAMTGGLTGPRGEANWLSLMSMPAADGTKPTAAQLAAVRDIILSFLQDVGTAAQ